MGIQQDKEKIKKIVQDYWDAANIHEVTVEDPIPDFLQGKLYAVSISDANYAEHQNYVYVVNGEFLRYDDLKQLVLSVGRDSLMVKLAKNLPSNISGLLAIFITLTLCWLALYKQNDMIVQALSNALIGILGFYFGSKEKDK